MSRETLDSLSRKWGSDKHVHGFTEFYEKFFVDLKDTKKVCEIGLGGVMWQQGGKLPGASSRMWLDYFPSAKVFILDNFSEVNKEEASVIEILIQENKERFHLIKGDQADREDLNSFITKAGNYINILIDDGGHSMNQQQVSLGFLFPYIKPGGLYAIEDLHTSIHPSRPRFGLWPDGSNSTLGMIENFLECGKIKSYYISENEANYLEANIESCEIFRNNNSITSILRKKL